MTRYYKDKVDSEGTKRDIWKAEKRKVYYFINDSKTLWYEVAMTPYQMRNKKNYREISYNEFVLENI